MLHAKNMMNISAGTQILLEASKNIPNTCGIYKMIGDKENILYVGKAKNLPKRIKQYTNINKMPNRLRLMVSLLKKVEFLATASEAEALILEAELIKSIKPKFNIALKDSKSFPYIAIDNNHKFPRIMKYRGQKKKNVSYFGPFTDVDQLEQSILEMEKIFKVRSCTDNNFKSRIRPCLLYQISRCSGPCVGKVDQEEYKKAVKQTKLFLSGNTAHVQKQLLSKMEKLSSSLKFEEAAKVRDTISLLNKSTKSFLIEQSEQDIDIFSYSSKGEKSCIQLFTHSNNSGNNCFYFDNIAHDNGELLMLFCVDFYKKNKIPKQIWVNLEKENIDILKDAIGKISESRVCISNPKDNSLMKFATQNAEKALDRYIGQSSNYEKTMEGMQHFFDLKSIPEKIEVYDNSHVQGSNAVGCMIVAGPNGFIKSQYRKFIIKENINPKGGDDYGMLREVISRRISKLEEKPDILLIDGGKGQLSTVLEILKKYEVEGIEVISIAKGKDRNAGKETFFTSSKGEVKIDYKSPVMYYLQNLRDEAHRFAITTYRKLHRKQMTKSKITDIPGIGIKRKKILLAIFGSYQKLTEASLEELEQVKNIGKNIASKIYSYLHGSKHI